MVAVEFLDDTGDIGLLLFGQFRVHGKGEHFFGRLFGNGKISLPVPGSGVGFLQMERHGIVNRMRNPFLLQQSRQRIPAGLSLLETIGRVRDLGGFCIAAHPAAKGARSLRPAAIRKALADPDREIRLTGAWGLARIGEADSAALLLKAAETKETWERVKATSACLLLAENLAKAGNRPAAAKIYTHLRTTRTDPSEQYIRDAAAKALKELGSPVA